MYTKWCMALLIVGVAMTTLHGDDAKSKKIDLKDIKCVMNPKAAAKLEKSVKFKGGQVFFCCDNCPKGFKAVMKDKKSAKRPMVVAKANSQLYATKQAKATKCPLTGRPLNAEQTVKVNGVDVAFCCPNCKGKVAKAEGDDQLMLVFGQKAFNKGFKTPAQIAKGGKKGKKNTDG